MALLIDPPSWPARGRLWSHLASDTSVEELHAFAAALGVPERGFEGDHYDLPEEHYAAAVAAGALPVPTRELLRRVRAAGLRRPKRRGEVVAASLSLGGTRIDTLVSALPPRRPVASVVLLAVRPEAGVVVGLPDGSPPVGAVPGRAGNGGEPVGAAELAGLIAEVLGEGTAVPQLRQLGYLRYRGPDGDRVEVVMTGPVRAGVDPVPPAGWADGGAVAEAAPSLAPLVRLALRRPPS